MEFMIRYNTISETNMFLRALWAALRQEQGTMGWQTFGIKDTATQEIYIGNLTSDILKTGKSVKVNYHKRGCISKLTISEINGSEINSSDVDLIKNAVDRASNYNINLHKAYMTTAYCSPFKYRLNPYHSNHLKIRTPLKHALGIIHFSVLGFDSEDRNYQAQKLLFIMADILSTCCSIPIHNGARIHEETECIKYTKTGMRIRIKEASDIGSRPEIELRKLKDISKLENINSFSDESWIDEYPVTSGGLLLPKSCIACLDALIKGSYTAELSIYNKAARLYNVACKYTSLARGFSGFYGLNIVDLDISPVEIANTLFMSSFEVLSTILDDNIETCKSCGQPRYQIRQKVINLFDTYMKDPAFSKTIDQYYRDRSSYVHAGIHLGDRSYTGCSIPQLDASDTGMISQVSQSNLNVLQEFGGYIFRNVLKTII